MRSERVRSEHVLSKQVVVVGRDHWCLSELQGVLELSDLRDSDCSLRNLDSKLHRVLEHGHLRHGDFGPRNLDDFVLRQHLLSQANSIRRKASELIG